MLVVFFAKRYDIEVARFARSKPVAKDMVSIRWWVLVADDARKLFYGYHMLKSVLAFLAGSIRPTLG